MLKYLALASTLALSLCNPTSFSLAAAAPVCPPGDTFDDAAVITRIHQNFPNDTVYEFTGAGYVVMMEALRAVVGASDTAPIDFADEIYVTDGPGNEKPAEMTAGFLWVLGDCIVHGPKVEMPTPAFKKLLNDAFGVSADDWIVQLPGRGV